MWILGLKGLSTRRIKVLLLLLLLSCSYSDPGILEKRKEKKLKSLLKGFLAIKSCHKHLQKLKTTGNNNSIIMRHTSFKTSKCKNQRQK